MPTHADADPLESSLFIPSHGTVICLTRTRLDNIGGNVQAQIKQTVTLPARGREKLTALLAAQRYHVNPTGAEDEFAVTPQEPVQSAGDAHRRLMDVFSQYARTQLSIAPPAAEGGLGI